MAFADSDPAFTSLGIRGVWIHDPDDPEGSVRQFVYGANQRSESYDSMGSGTYYVGREDPVFDFGDPSSTNAEFTVDVPHGSDYRQNLEYLRAFAKTKKNLWIRDNRSRALYGMMSGLKITDAAWGSTVSFSFTQAHRVIEEVAVS